MSLLHMELLSLCEEISSAGRFTSLPRTVVVEELLEVTSAFWQLVHLQAMVHSKSAFTQLQCRVLQLVVHLQPAVSDFTKSSMARMESSVSQMILHTSLSVVQPWSLKFGGAAMG